MIIINIHPATDEARRLWSKALELAEVIGDEDDDWALVGGLMVQLHGFEHGSEARPTVDIDLLGDSRSRPAMTEKIAETVMERGGEMAMPSIADENTGYKFDFDGETVEVLGSEGVRGDPKTIGKHTTFKVPGGTQALRRTETVLVSLDGAPAVPIRRPNLLGAILIKARVVAKRRSERFESDRQDLIRLLGFVDDPRAMAVQFRGKEKRWLAKVEQLLDFADTGLAALFSAERLARAEQAYRLLVA